MKLAILSRGRDLYSTRRLVQTARRRGIEPSVLDVLKISVSLETARPRLYYQGAALPAPDGVIPRIGTSVTSLGIAVVRQLEAMDVYCANTALGIANARDKLRCLQILARHGISIPPTELVGRREDIQPAIARVGGAPLVIKLKEGTQGVGVILAETAEVAEAIVETLRSAKQKVLIQKFVAESRGRDIRAFVVGGRVVAAMRRVAQGREFRSNVHRGAVAGRVALGARYERTALRAAEVLGLEIAGVDMLEATSGPQVMEVNASPGLEGIETATRIDIAGAILDHVQDQVQTHEIDRQDFG